jgi:excinuclease ABC subunit A
VAAADPETLSRVRESHTGQALVPVLARGAGEPAKNAAGEGRRSA